MTVNEFLESLYKSTHNRVQGNTAACELFGEHSPFRIVCARCGSTQVEIIGERGVEYSEYTGYAPGSTVIKCTGCGAAVSAEE